MGEGREEGGREGVRREVGEGKGMRASDGGRKNGGRRETTGVLLQ